MDQLFRIKNLKNKLTAFDVLLALEKHTELKGLAVEIEKISASRDSRILSAVPSVKEINDFAQRYSDSEDKNEDVIVGAVWAIEKIKRGIAG